MSRLVSLAIAFLALTSTHATAQDPRIRDRLDRATATAVSSLIDSATRAGIPAEPLIQRALQGSIKKAPGSLIIAAVRELSVELGAAKSVLGPQSPRAELVAAASALHAGATATDLRTLRAARPRQPLTVALATLADLVSHGVPVAQATETIRVALAKGANDAEIVALRRNIERDIKAGAPPSAAAGVRARGLPAKKTGQHVQPASKDRR